MAYKVFKDQFVEGTHTEEQVDLCYDFLFTLEKCVAQGAINLWGLSMDPGDTKVAVLLKRLEVFKDHKPSSKKYKGNSKVLLRVIGSAVEEQAYYLLAQEYDVAEDDTGDYALELAGKSGDLFPHSFTGKGGKKGSRPDVRPGARQWLRGSLRYHRGDRHQQRSHPQQGRQLDETGQRPLHRRGLLHREGPPGRDVRSPGNRHRT